MAKCGACGKFMPNSDTNMAKCTKCPSSYHRACVVIPSGIRIASSWTCPSCQIRTPKEDSTPVKGLASGCEVLARNCIVQEDSVLDEKNLDLAAEIRSLRDELGAMRGELRECRMEITEFKSCLQTCFTRIDTLEGRVLDLEQNLSEQPPPDVVRLESTICDLRLQLNEREQDIFCNDVEVTGIPETKGESSPHIALLVAQKLGLNLDERELVFAERFGAVRRDRVDGDVARSRALVIRFARRALRDGMLRAARVRRGLTTADLELSGASQRCYVNERLSRHNKQLFYKAREIARCRAWKFVWTKDGRIFTRKDEGKPVHRIRSNEDLQRIFVVS